MTETPPILTVDKLTFARGACDVLTDVSWQINAGDFAFIVGENGAGKTTLLKCLCQVLEPRLGHVELAGRKLSSYGSRELARMLSYLPQADHRVVPYRVRDFVAMGRYPYLNPWGGLTPADREAVDTAMAKVGVDKLGDRIMTTLSGGERRKVSLAAALAQGARVLLLDEPATFLDPRHQVDLRRILRQLNDDGITIIAVTHDLNTMAALATRVLALRHGRAVYTGSATDYLAPEPLRQTYDIDFHILRDKGQTRVYPQESA